jgi:hypothetical protein
MQIYENWFGLDSCCPPAERPPVRYVIWAWQSGRSAVRPSKDYRLKTKRSMDQGWTLAMMLNLLGDRHMMLAGYSLGSQVIVSAISHLDARVQTHQDGYRMVMIAPVLDCDFANRCFDFRSLGGLIRDTAIFANERDHVTGLVHSMCRRQYGCQAESLESRADAPSAPFGSVCHFDITQEVKPAHSIVKYSESVTMKQYVHRILTDLLLGNETGVTTVGMLPVSEPTIK